MSVTKSQLEYILGHLQEFHTGIKSRHTVLKTFVREQRKHYGPFIEIFLKDRWNNLYNTTVEFMGKGDKLRYRQCRLCKILPIKGAIVLRSQYDMQYFEAEDLTNGPKEFPLMLLTEGQRDCINFIAEHFGIPVESEDELIKKAVGEVKCISCGKCCKFYPRVGITKEDIDRWKIEKRTDILEKLTGSRKVYLNLNEHSGGCSFLVNNKCSIHDTKPTNCSLWPSVYADYDQVKCEAYLLKLEAAKKT